jgi:hypothetical protein
MQAPIMFDRQLSRPSILSKDVHESRFMFFNDNPVISTKFKRVVSPVFKKSLARKPLNLEILQIPDYNPHFEALVDRTGTASPQWKTKQGRKSETGKVLGVTYDIKYSTVDRQVSVPVFDKSPQRPESMLTSLPSFMCAVNSRQAMNQLNEKSLKMSKYTARDFFSPRSSFDPKTPKNKLLQTLGSASPKLR